MRASRTLAEVDAVAAEDTRHTLKLLNHLGIKKPMISYWGEKEKARAEVVIERLRQGDDVALVSDAGTPGISDPGAVVVARAAAEGIEIIAIPGPSALVAALSVCGLPTEEFTFIGFMPSKRGSRQRRIKALSLEPRTMVFYESPHRIIDTLIDMEEVLGGARRAVLFKELTKIHETITRGTLAEILDTLEEAVVAGEYVIVLDGHTPDEERPMEEALEEVGSLMKKGLGRKQAVRQVAEQYGINKKELYALSLESAEDDDDEEAEE